MMKRYVSNAKEIKVFKWDGFQQTLLHNIPKNKLLSNFEYNNDSLYVITPKGSQLCKIGYYVIDDSENSGYYFILSPTQLKGQYVEIN